MDNRNCGKSANRNNVRFLYKTNCQQTVSTLRKSVYYLIFALIVLLILKKIISISRIFVFTFSVPPPLQIAKYFLDCGATVHQSQGCKDQLIAECVKHKQHVSKSVAKSVSGAPTVTTTTKRGSTSSLPLPLSTSSGRYVKTIIVLLNFPSFAVSCCIGSGFTASD